MPDGAHVWTSAGEVATTRATTAFTYDPAGETFDAPYAPACCTDNACVGRTIPYFGSPREAGERGVRGVRLRPLVGVWPPEAKGELDFAGEWSDVAPPRRGPGPRGFQLLASTDLDHDGKRERIVYEVWANDFGFDVVDASGAAIYAYSCGNI